MWTETLRVEESGRSLVDRISKCPLYVIGGTVPDFLWLEALADKEKLFLRKLSEYLKIIILLAICCNEIFSFKWESRL